MAYFTDGSEVSKLCIVGIRSKCKMAKEKEKTRIY